MTGSLVSLPIPCANYGQFPAWAGLGPHYSAARGKLLFAGLGLLGGLSLAHDLELAVWPVVLALSALQKASQDERQDRWELKTWPQLDRAPSDRPGRSPDDNDAARQSPSGGIA